MKRKIYICLMAVLTLFTSCDSYLDVSPSDQQTAEQLFAVKAGYYTALNGIYDGLASEALYGKEMTWGALDVMGQRYAAPNGNTAYQELSSGAFTGASAAPILSNIWGKAYELILASNILMEQLDNREEGIMTEAEAQLIKGELYAIRAFLHLDMMRLFGPRVEDNPEALCIPYNEDTQVRALDLLPCSQVTEKIIKDLDEAELLLAEVDPVIENGPLASAGEANDDIQMRYRQFRFNYYSVIALKARAYLWGGDKENAFAQAKRVLEDATAQAHFPAVDPNKLLANSNNPDRVFSSEVLTGIYVKTRDNVYTQNFSADASKYKRLQPYSTFIAQTLFTIPLLYIGETSDYRFQTQWEVSSSAGSQGYILSKYKSIEKPDPDDEDSEYFYSKMIPLVKMQELYYIAAECDPDVNAQVNWFNTARARRGCAPNDYLTFYWAGYGYGSLFLTNEFMREFYGEGQAYYFSKRAVTFPGMPAGYVSPLENGAGYMETMLTTPPLPEGEMK